MKKIFLSLLLIFVSLIGTGCFDYGSDYTKGVSIDDYEPNASVVGVTCLVPEGFQDEYKYSDGKFYWATEMNEDYFYLLEKMDRALMWLSYEETEYELAKNYVLSEMNLDLSNEQIYNEYHFYIVKPGMFFPFQYHMVCYNDQKSMLIFIRMCCNENKYPDTQYGLTDFGLYLETFFGDFYDFNI